MDYSLGLLKPDCLKRGIEKEVLSEIEAAGLEIAVVKKVRLTKKEVDVIWESCLKEDFYQELLQFSLSGDCLIFIVKGENSIGRLNDLVGYYEPEMAKEGTIRHRFGRSAMENVIHSTGNEETFLREASLFFSRLELSGFIQEK